MSNVVAGQTPDNVSENNGTESTQAVETRPIEVTASESEDIAAAGQSGGNAEQENFPASVVQDLRKENAGWRVKLKHIEQQLHYERVKATGLLADPADLAFDESHLIDDQAIVDAINALIETKPHLRARKVTGDIGQGRKDAGSGELDLAAFLRSRV